MAGEAETPSRSTGQGRSCAEWLEEAAECVAAGSHAARRENPTPSEVAERVGALHHLAARLQQHMDSCAAALEAASHRPGLTSTDESVEARVVASNASFRLHDLCGRKHVTGLVEQLSAAHAEAASLSDTLSGAPDPR